MLLWMPEQEPVSSKERAYGAVAMDNDSKALTDESVQKPQPNAGDNLKAWEHSLLDALDAKSEKTD